jgi:ATP-dependent Clp protease protease subunit
MQFVKCDVRTYCTGMAASMGSLLLMAGTKGKRYILPHGRVMIHQPIISGGLQGQVSDIEIHAKEFVDMKKRLTNLYVKHTGQSFDRLMKDMDRDNYMSAEEALKYGLVDQVVSDRKGEKNL